MTVQDMSEGILERTGKVSEDGHPLNPPKSRRHRGDIMSPATRSAVMSRIRGKDTGPEKIIAAGLASAGLQWESHVRDLPGHPDFVFRAAQVAVFVDGDFWHGWRFDTWRDKLSEKWEAKIAATRRWDSRNRKQLRDMGWQVVRVWEHQIEKDTRRCIRRILRAVAGRAVKDQAEAGVVLL